MFARNQKVVYPGHGVAEISNIIEKKIAGMTVSFFELKFLSKDMTILVPTENTESVGLRTLSSSDKINDIFKILKEPAKPISYDLNASNWNKRNKEYRRQIRSGSLCEISQIYRDLQYIAFKKELSFGEKNLLNETETLLAQEISLVQKVDEQKAIQQLRSQFKPSSQAIASAL